MQNYNNLVRAIKAHAKKEGITMHAESIINFLDHITSEGDSCEMCAKVVEAYTQGEVKVDA